jgi:SNF2 family DNA or RNA helicase
MLIDEAQEAKSKNSFRGRAIRAIRTKGVALLTGTLMKGYISDVFWNVGKLMGFANLLFPYAYRGGSKMFLGEFGTYEYVSKQFADTLHEGRARLLPEVSNLNRFWRILASFTVRRLKDSMVELPPKHRHYELVPMTALQTEAYGNLEEWAKKKIQEALQQEEPNMGKISQALWKLRFAATVPTDQDKLGDYAIPAVTWAKIDRIADLVKEIKKRGEQVVIFASLRSMVHTISERLKRERLSHVKLTASTDVQKRLSLIDDFETNGHTALVAGTNCANRAFTITCANNVIIANLEFSPEPTLQAEDRVHRTGQDKEVNVHYLISENTIDQDMWELITKKGEAIKHAIDMEARDISVAELLESKAELEVAIRVLGRKKTKQTSPAVIKTKYSEESSPTPPSLKAKRPQKPKSAKSWQGNQLDFFTMLTKKVSGSADTSQN